MRFATPWLDAKKKTDGDRERDAVKRAAFLVQLAALSPSQRVYMDESGMDERADDGDGWSPRGQRLAALKAGRRSGRINMIAASWEHQLGTPTAGSIDGRRRLSSRGV